MVLKRQCSFCAAEIEPGTGTMFVKRDGTVFHFCTSSCRKQQLHLGRVGHRLKWTRAHALKRAADRSSAAARATTVAAPTAEKPKRKAPVAPPAETKPAPPETKAKPPAKPRTRAKKPAAAAGESKAK